jgi:hypothetical protein
VSCSYFAYSNPISYYWKAVYSIQSILDKSFFLCMWRCSNFVFTKPTKSNARWNLLNSMRKENTNRKHANIN